MGKKILIGMGIVLGGLLGLIVIAGIAGMFLAPEFSGEARITLGKPPEEVWQAINDYKRLPVSSAQSQRVEELPAEGGLPAWKEDIGSTTLTFRTTESQAPSRLVRAVSDAVVPMTMRIEYEIAAQGTGSQVRIRVNGRVDSGTLHVPFFRVMLRMGAAAAGQRAFLESLARHLGENATAE